MKTLCVRKAFRLPYAYRNLRFISPIAPHHSASSFPRYRIPGNTAAALHTYIKSSPWKGAAEGFHDYSYSITFQKINMVRMEAVIHCDIDFKKDDIPDLNKTITVDLIEGGGSFNLHFEIDYTYPGIVSNNEESLWFWLDVDTGLAPF